MRNLSTVARKLARWLDLEGFRRRADEDAMHEAAGARHDLPSRALQTKKCQLLDPIGKPRSQCPLIHEVHPSSRVGSAQDGVDGPAMRLHRPALRRLTESTHSSRCGQTRARNPIQRSPMREDFALELRLQWLLHALTIARSSGRGRSLEMPSGAGCHGRQTSSLHFRHPTPSSRIPLR
jgi:hypothetical protein